MMAYYKILFNSNNVSQKLCHISTTFIFQKLYFILQMHQHLFFELLLNRYFIISKFLLLQIMLQYGFIKYILGFNMGTFEFPTTEILVPTCILKYKIQYQFALEIGSIYTSINNIQNYLFIHILNSVLLTFFDFCKYDR